MKNVHCLLARRGTQDSGSQGTGKTTKEINYKKGNKYKKISYIHDIHNPSLAPDRVPKVMHIIRCYGFLTSAVMHFFRLGRVLI